jgi:hypothetical protein
MQLPSKTKEIIVHNNTYTVSFPNNRQLMTIYSRKAQLSKEMYDALSLSNDGNARYVAMLIDAVSTFEVLMPEEFFNDLNFKNILDADVIVGANLVKIYREQYEEWFNSWTSTMAKILQNNNEEKKNDE